MSEGGQFPWKRRKHTAKEAPNYQRLLQPLPDPPAGLLWVRNHSSGETPWKLVSTLGDAVAVMAPDNTTSHSYDGTVSAPCVALANEQSMDSDARLYGAVAPEATVVPLASATTNATDSKLPTVENSSNETNEEAEQEVSALPRASLVPAVPKVAQFPKTEPTSTDCSNHDTSEKKDEDLERLHPTWGRYGVDYTEHVLLKDVDTLAGLCLRYHIDRRVLQRANRFYGDNLRLAPDRLIIPITDKARQLGWHAQDEQSHAFQMASLLAQFPSLSTMEAQWYVKKNDTIGARVLRVCIPVFSSHTFHASLSFFPQNGVG